MRKHRYRAFRARVRARHGIDLAYRSCIGVIGGVVLVAGIVMIPYPGPGWLVVFAALALLGTEFNWARRLLHHARVQYDRWDHWMRSRSPLLRLAVLAITGLVVLVTLWLLNVFGIAAYWLRLDWPWLSSPLGPFA
ncbi:MAG: TIGR02611 family protein [Pseudonocardiaceae bacterium]|nr:TIGR02611 family protein [Pseudonocardiaceae bacterium]